MSNMEMNDYGKWVAGSLGVLLLLVTPCVWGRQRTVTALTDNWHIKQLDTDEPDVAALTRSAVSPDDT